MNVILRALCASVILLTSGLAQTASQASSMPVRSGRPVHTFSIVARDPQTGEIGVAVQSHWFCVGCNIVAWAEPGVGAVATQAMVDVAYGPLGLDLMRAGKSAPEALRSLLSSDSARNVRQAAFIDSHGKVAVWSGAKDMQFAGHEAGHPQGAAQGGFAALDGGTFTVGEEFSTEANLMSSDKIWPAMAKAFQQTKGDLADRMLAALDAGQAVGGDVRGRQSAALIVVSGDRSDKPWQRKFDVRVDDSPEPLKELRRLVTLNRAYNHMNAGDLAMEHKDREGALREYSAGEKLVENVPGIEPSRRAEMLFWHAVALVNMNRVDDALPLFHQAFQIHPQWAELVPRLPKSDVLPDDPKLIERILSVK